MCDNKLVGCLLVIVDVGMGAGWGELGCAMVLSGSRGEAQVRPITILVWRLGADIGMLRVLEEAEGNVGELVGVGKECW